jgi:glycosyltransferase involved in cell wall biosynthesis
MGKKKSKKPQGPDEIDQALAELPPLPPELATAKPKPMVPLKATPEEMRRPFVSVLCVTYNRRPFIPTFLEMVRNQDYPQSRIEIIIVDDGTDPIKDIVDAAAMPNVRYYRMETKVPLGTKRNYANSLIDKKTKYVIPMDDDDVMMSERISHSVDMLERNPGALCAGSSEMFLYFKHIKKLYKFGPYMVSPEAKKAHEANYGHRNRIGANLDDYIPIPTQHATNGTFAYRRELIDITKYDSSACLAEEKKFLKEYTIPMVQLNPFKCILCISHEHNTFDKRKLLENMNPMFVCESDRDVDCFFKLPKEAHIKRFFMEEVDKLLDNYAPGLPNMKPDVQKQIKEIEAERDKMMREQMAQQQAQQHAQQQQGQPAIVIQQPGQPPQQLSMEDVVNLIRQQQTQIDFLTRTVDELHKTSLGHRQRLMATMVPLTPRPAANPEPMVSPTETFTRIEIAI